MPSPVVANWFGEDFKQLHPMLQSIHTHGGQLTGQVVVTIPTGLAGVIGTRIARKLGVPPANGLYRLAVNISHHSGCLHWDRCFDERAKMHSVFEPIGTRADGYWLERTGPLAMRLTVDIRDGGWYWRCLALRWLGIPLPRWLFPRSSAYKTIEGGRYRFYVGFALPIVGTVLSYSGMLVPAMAIDNTIRVAADC